MTSPEDPGGASVEIPMQPSRQRQQAETHPNDDLVPETQLDEETGEIIDRTSAEPDDPRRPATEVLPPIPDPQYRGNEGTTTAQEKDMLNREADPQGATGMHASGRDSDAGEGEAAQVRKRPATAEQLSDALQLALREASTKRPRLQAWLDLMQQLFMKVCPKSQVKRANMTTAAQRLPKLTRLEQERLVDLFDDIVVKGQKPETEWNTMVEDACNTVFKTRQSLEYVLSKLVGKLAVQEAANNAPVLTEWAQKVGGQETPVDAVQKAQKAFLFNQREFSPEETTCLRRVCEQTYGKHKATAFRDGTEDEWRIVQGLVEGTIICRKLPQFINRIMTTPHKLRVIGTIRAQVEGTLAMDLEGELPIKEAFQNTKSLQESIATACTTRGLDSKSVWSMLAAVKTISYNAAKHEIHFHFFTREDARQFDKLVIPFHRRTHVLYNVHAQTDTVAEDSIWNRQVESDGAIVSQAAEYVVTLRNVARTVDLSRFHGFLKKKLEVTFDLDDLDLGGPTSSTSTSWELSFPQAGCPQKLDGVERIVWFGLVIVIQHPHMRGRQQCLRCGRLGHPMRVCSMTSEALRGRGSLIATEEELADLPENPATFTSLEQLKEAVITERKRQESSIPPPKPNGTEKSSTHEQTPAARGPVRKPEDTLRVDRSEKEWFEGGAKRKTSKNPRTKDHLVPDWTTAKPSKSDRKQTTREEAPGSRFDTITMDSSVEEEVKVDGINTPGPTQPKRPKARRTASDMQQVNAELLVEEGAAKADLADALSQVLGTQGDPKRKTKLRHAKQVAEDGENVKVVLADGLQEMDVHEVSTPATGNCQVYAVAQALANSDLQDQPERLALAAAALKRGCAARAKIDFALKYTHQQRKATLLTLGRGYEKMAAPVSEEEFRKYLHDYSTSPSGISDFLPAAFWGSNDTLAAFGMMLQRDIIVISTVPDSTDWSALHYEPETRHGKQKDYATCGEYPLSAAGCVKRVKDLVDKAGDNANRLPLLLHFHCDHYQAYVFNSPSNERGRKEDDDVHMEEPEQDEGDRDQEEHTHRDTRMAGDAAAQEKKDTLPPSGSNKHNRRAVEDEDNAKTEEDEPNGPTHASYGSQSPWNPDEWDGNLSDLEHRLDGPTIHHSLKQEVQLILKEGGDRTAELLSFLESTVSQLSLYEQQRLLEANLEDPKQLESFMKNFGIPQPVVLQWQDRLRKKQSGENSNRHWESPPAQVAQSDSDYVPTSSQSSDRDHGIRREQTRRTPQRPTKAALLTKRAHAATPEDRREEGGNVVNVNNTAVPLKKRSVNDPTKTLLPFFEETDSDDRTSVAKRIELLSWPVFWNAYASEWANTTQIPFPDADSSVEIWLLAARSEPARILEMIRRFSRPHEIIRRLASTVLVELTAQWRADCWQAAVEEGQARESSDPVRVRRLAQWQRRVDNAKEGHLRRALMNSSQDWQAERDSEYGKDAVMRLCAPIRVHRLANHLLCAFVYAERIAAILGVDSSPDDFPVVRLGRHLHALRTTATYKASFLAADHSFTWESVGRYMDQAVGEGEDLHAIQQEGSLSRQY